MHRARVPAGKRLPQTHATGPPLRRRSLHGQPVARCSRGNELLYLRAHRHGGISPCRRGPRTVSANTQNRLGQCGSRDPGDRYRSERDVRALVREDVRIRLVKSAYLAPSQVALPRRQGVDRNFDRLAKILIEATADRAAKSDTFGGRTPPYVAIATHDERRIAFARKTTESLGLPRERVEFPMLCGIRPNLQPRLLQERYPARVYVPYGPEWYPFLT